MPSISMKPLVPSNPGPPNDPNSFWAPWPAISDPCARRTMNGAASLTLEPLDLAVLTLAPSVVLSGFVDLPRGEKATARALYPRRYGCIPAFRSCPRPDFEEGVLSGIRTQHPAHRGRYRNLQAAWRRFRTRGPTTTSWAVAQMCA